ncbi:MAG: glycoside hydrolase family 2 TIM barrel-domain containing protein [Sphingomicrobium sp.]
MRFALLFLAALLSMSTVAHAGDVVPFDDGWRFAKGDIARAEATAAADAGWQLVSTPHDWSIAGPFDEHALATGSGGFLPTGVAWYRKHFDLAPKARGKRLFIEFDGVMDRSGVWINGMHLGHRPNGYSSFRYELTPFLKDRDNVVAVRADTSAQPASRWYAGSGIYRHVRLIVSGDVHIDTWGTRVTTPSLDGPRATVKVESSILNESAAPRIGRLEVAILDPNGRTVGTALSQPMSLPAQRVTKLSAEAVLANARRWDIKDPALHRAIVRVVGEGGAELNRDEVTFGIRDARFEAATGFWLNGRNIKLKGAALHADGGALGMAVPLAFWERRLRGLQKLGVNAIRTAHHPFSPEVLDLCDRLGIIVMDEAFDMWTVAKNPHDYHLFFTDWSSIDARDFVRRDRNHPSVVIWSMGNEIHDTAYPVVTKSIIESLKAIFHEEDPTRPVTMALFRPNTTGDYQNGVAELLDVVGQNYREKELAKAHADKPTWKIVGTENSKNRESWLVVRDDPAYAGMFLWTGADYLGEADRSGWPAISNPSGLVDRTDVVKPEGLERASWWSEAPVISIARRITQRIDTSELPTMVGVAMPQPKGAGALADWTPADLSPHPEKVEVYSNAPEVELFLNGKSLGRKPRNADDRARQWETIFVPGSVRALGYDGKRKVGEAVLRTAGPAIALRLVSESTSVGHGFDDLAFVRVEAVDASGMVVPGAADEVSLSVTGAGNLVAFDNGAVADHTPFQSPIRKLKDGKALATVRGNGTNGSIQVTASAPGLKSASARIAAR